MKLKIMFAILLLASFSAFAEVKQELGVDQRVDYTKLVAKYGGPWDDRNYQLTLEDLSILPENDHVVRNVPVFFKIKARRANPHINALYPRELYQAFLIHYGGLIVDGHWYKEGIGLYRHPNALDGKPDPSYRGGTIDPDGEVVLDGGAETTIEFNPDNNMLAVAGANANGGQSMYYSTDGAQTWTFSQLNPGGSCCDPTVDWSTTDVIPQRVYQADLSSCGFGGCNIRASYSEDGGQTWAPMIDIDADQANDKEFIHVDRSATSPYKDNVYITYHKGNQMRFAKSEDNGTTWTTPVNVGVELGIGSDITTDAAGNIYYVYPNANPAASGIPSNLWLLKSTDGGDTFEAPVLIETLRGNFDFPIPAMETREVFIYASVDVDSNDNIYVAVTDETADSTGAALGADPATNRAEIRIFKSTDAGATWNEMAQPHPVDGLLSGGSDNAIDRFHPWLTVAENDVVHIGFYDTRNSVNRTGVDFYYNVSQDGGATWLPEGAQRYSTQTSSNIGDNFEWGDYNGLSVVLDKLAMIWTDNRASSTDVMVGFSNNQFGEPTFFASANSTDIAVCAGDTGTLVDINITEVLGYTGTITLSENTVPGFVSNGAFSSNTQTAPFTSEYTFDVGAGSPNGEATLSLLASGDDNGNITERMLDINLIYSDGAPGVTTLLTPADAAVDTLLAPVFTWDTIPGVTGYTIDVATDDLFSNIVLTDTVDTNTYTPASDLLNDTEYFWRVTGNSACGAGTASSVFSFTTNSDICFVVNTDIPDNTAAGIDITRNVSETGTIGDLIFSANAQHTWIGDLIFTLTHETSGTSVVLIDRVGVPGINTVGCNDDNIDVILDDAAANPVETACANANVDPGLSGTLIPENPLAGFDGLELSGDWTLNVSDNAGQDTGSVVEFCLFPTIDPCDPAPPVNDPDIIWFNGFQCVQQTTTN